MQDFIAAHLNEKITSADLAKVSFFSPWYSFRLFKLHTGLAPGDYIRRLRLTKSAQQLKIENCKVIDAAYDAGFDSVDGYQRAFRREFNCNPSEYARHPVPIQLFIPYGVKFRELRKEEVSMGNLQSVFIQLVHKPERKVIIKRGKTAKGYWTYCNEVGCDVWGILTSMDSLCGEPVCLMLTERYIEPGTSTYVQGVEVDVAYDGVIPDGFDVITLPEADYLMFQGEPYAEEDYVKAIKKVQSAMSKYNPSVIGYEWDDGNPCIQLEPRGERGYIELRAVKKQRG